MKKLFSLIMCVIIIISTTPVQSSPKLDGSPIPFYIYNSATQFRLDVTLMYALCKKESNCRPGAVNHSDGTPEQKAAGIVVKSYGLFQLQVATAEGLGFVSKETVTVEQLRHGKLVKVKRVIDHTRDLLKPEINSWYAAMLMRRMYDKYHNNTEKAISAYNAGHAIASNREYVKDVLSKYAVLKLDKRF